MREISQLDEDVLAFREGLCSMESVRYSVSILIYCTISAHNFSPPSHDTLHPKQLKGLICTTATQNTVEIWQLITASSLTSYNSTLPVLHKLI
jgi:hypothetical protein